MFHNIFNNYLLTVVGALKTVPGGETHDDTFIKELLTADDLQKGQ